MLTPEQRDELARLERALAYSAARSDVECYCAYAGQGWHNPANVLDSDHETVTTAIRYLDLRGLLDRHPDGWVRVRDA